MADSRAIGVTANVSPNQNNRFFQNNSIDQALAKSSLPDEIRSDLAGIYRLSKALQAQYKAKEQDEIETQSLLDESLSQSVESYIESIINAYNEYQENESHLNELKENIQLANKAFQNPTQNNLTACREHALNIYDKYHQNEKLQKVAILATSMLFAIIALIGFFAFILGALIVASGVGVPFGLICGGAGLAACVAGISGYAACDKKYNKIQDSADSVVRDTLLDMTNDLQCRIAP